MPVSTLLRRVAAAAARRTVVVPQQQQFANSNNFVPSSSRNVTFSSSISNSQNALLHRRGLSTTQRRPPSPPTPQPLRIETLLRTETKTPPRDRSVVVTVAEKDATSFVGSIVKDFAWNIVVYGRGRDVFSFTNIIYSNK